MASALQIELALQPQLVFTHKLRCPNLLVRFQNEGTVTLVHLVGIYFVKPQHIAEAVTD